MHQVRGLSGGLPHGSAGISGSQQHGMRSLREMHGRLSNRGDSQGLGYFSHPRRRWLTMDSRRYNLHPCKRKTESNLVGCEL